ncbi:hypothetical protein ALQ72_00422 [Pseudomonas syringae pv. maculicola]|uniref:ABM domain-containing protein n=1 Tax=Pseudomonas syringae pv. maculicola TaxID=59511 RepID=A0A3M3GLD0_PSEYM|nr:hypothetical protein ALQ72_00422 [Pseudomonas syringae pv. maculicola]RMV29244.1 hypothetical protein ALP13_104159 [Pseudomonas syringae pv. maculicola]
MFSVRDSPMSKLAINTIELQVKMDNNLHMEILSRLKNIKRLSPQCVEYDLTQSTNLKSWIIKFTWIDAASMHNHFSSESLQTLLTLLTSRCTKLYFEKTLNTEG